MPLAFRGALLWLRDRYNNPAVFVTENGIATTPEVGNKDVARAAYHSVSTAAAPQRPRSAALQPRGSPLASCFQDYLRALVDAVRNDGCNVIGMTAWSLLDGFEFGSE